jgi:alkanesulfonate monooxygenase SsuD/methylene tetrahydromethanopterin reductase-like flavin-dependent oxidoreductase (luciferase family)
MTATATRRQLHLGVLLAGAGHHPAAWRHASARPDRLFTPDHLVAQVQAAERGTLDLVIADDTFAPQPERTDRVRGRFDALLAMARAAPHTRAIGLVPTVDVTHTEPFHVSKNVATLDLISRGRAGWRIGLSTTDAEARLFGRKPAAPLDELVDEADEVADVVARLWDSWEDDAVIRDRATGRYIDRDKVHPVDFAGRFFQVRGPSITPRPPQGQPLVVDATSSPAVALAAARADVALVAAAEPDAARRQRLDLRRRAGAAGRHPDDLAVLVVADVLLGGDRASAADERRSLDELAGGGRSSGNGNGNGNGNGSGSGSGSGSGKPGDRFAGTLDLVGPPDELAASIEEWFRAGAADGFVLRPALLPLGLDQIVDLVVPRLRAAGVFRSAYDERSLRPRFGLDRPPNRYADAGAATTATATAEGSR